MTSRIKKFSFLLFPTGFWCAVIGAFFNYAHSNLAAAHPVLTVLAGFILAVLIPIDLGNRREIATESALLTMGSVNGSSHSGGDADGGG